MTDDPEWTDEDFAKARPADELPEAIRKALNTPATYMLMVNGTPLTETGYLYGDWRANGAEPITMDKRTATLLSLVAYHFWVDEAKDMPTVSAVGVRHDPDPSKATFIARLPE